jgi:hypothetical protein
MKQEKVITILHIVFQLVNILVGVLVVVIGALRFASVAGNRLDASTGINVIITTYICIFGVFTVLCSFIVPNFLYHYIGFMCHYITRGLFYIFLGGLLFTKIAINIVASCICWSFGIGFIVLFFIPGFRYCVPLVNHIVASFDNRSPISASSSTGNRFSADYMSYKDKNEQDS